MMAISAELSMKQAAALSLQQQIKEKELQVRGGTHVAKTKGSRNLHRALGCATPQCPTGFPIIFISTHWSWSKGQIKSTESDRT